jgi:lysozyme
VQLSETGRRLIEALEGFGAQPYRNVLGRWAIGFGHTYGITEQTPAIGREQADDLLEEDITGSYGPAIDALGLPLTQAQFDAVCSFVYQLGVGVLSRASPFGSHLLARDWVAAGNAMLLYDQPAGVPVPELQHRRSLERALFLAPPMPASSSLAVLNRPERAAAARYESLLAQGVSDHEQLARMREGLALLRQLVWVAAVRGQGSNGSQVSPGWDIDLRRERYAVLAKLSGWTA